MQIKELQWERALHTALLVLLLSVVGMGKGYAYHHDVTIGDLNYSLYYDYSNTNIPTATVTGHKDGTNATGSLNIPSSVTYTSGEYINGQHVYVTRTYTVTAIGGLAFRNCSGLIGYLTIPNTVTSIGGQAFENCSGFTGNLTIPNTVTSINGRVFYGCSGFTGDLTIPNTVTYIGWKAFENCSGITGSLTIPSSVIYIGCHAFKNCSSLSAVYYDADIVDDHSYFVNSVDDYWCPPFQGCSGNLVIGDNVDTIPKLLFSGGFSGSLTIGNSVISIGEMAFCGGFTGSLIIPNSVMTIGSSAFYYCSGFTGSLTIGNSVTIIGNEAFARCSGFTGSLTIGNSVTTIGNEAFARCSGFTGSLTIGNSVTTIGYGAFSGCSGFTGNLIIPNSVTTIGAYAFYNCSGFDGTLTLPNNESFTKIESSTFYGCSGFTGNLNIPNSVTTIDGSAFRNCSGFNGTLTLPNNESFTKIESSTFYGCSGFTGNLTIPNSITSIGSYAFYNCSGFTGNLNIPNSVTMIGSFAFYNCSGFNGTLTLPNNESFAKIESSTFYGCSGFTGNLNIPNSVTSIGSSAFKNCSGFSEVHYNVPNHSDFSYSWDSPFYGCGGNLVIGNNVQRIPNYMFYYGAFTGNLTIPNTVTSIGNYAFYNLLGTSSFSGNLQIGSSVESIGTMAFSGCNFTGDLIIPNSVTSIGTSAFWGCHFFSSLTLGNGTVSIGPQAFRDCPGIIEIHYNAINCQTAGSANSPVFNEMSNLRKIIIGENVETLPDYLFANCFSTLFIRSYSEVPPTVGGAGTFYGIDRGISVGVPCDSQEDYEEAEYWSEFTNYTGSEYQLAVKANPEHLGRAVIVQQPDCNTTICIVRALPNRGCRFLNWTCNGEVVTQIHSYAFTIDEDMVMVANFEPMKRFTGGGGTIVWSDPANWEPIGVPIDTMGVDIQSDVIIDTDVNVGSIYNYGNHVVTVMPAAVLTVNQTLGSPDPFGLVIEDGGQVVHHSEGVMATVRKTVDAYDATHDGWNLISSPLADTGYVASVMNLLSNDYDLYYYDEPTHYWKNQEYTANSFDQLEAGKGYLYANCGVQNCVFDQAVYVTDRGLIDGHDASVLQGSQITAGRNVTHNTALLADDFTISASTTINAIEVYGFQTNSDTISSFTGFYAQIYDGNPMNGGQPIWGDENTNIMTFTNWTECYREDMTRPIMRIVADNLNIELEAGTYYLVWSLSCGSTSWGVPVAISHIENTGNGLQYWQGSWGYASDSGTEKGIGFAFRLYGTSGQSTTNNASFSFVGELRNSSANVSIPLNYTESAGNLKGLNLVGNPFVCNAYLLDENNEPLPFFKMNDTGDAIAAVQAGMPIKPCEGVIVVCPNDRQGHSAVFTTAAPSNIGEAQNVPAVLLPIHELPVNQNAFLTNSITQTTTLSAGTNWFSTYLDISLDDLKAALVAAAAPNTTIMIKNATQSAVYSRGRWNGTLDWDVAKRYNIKVASTCELTLEGLSIVPSEHPVTVVGGGMATWIGFPLGESMSLTNAFAGFAQNGDMVKSQYGNAVYSRDHWNGGLYLEPGKGYLYISAPTAADRTLTFPTSAK